MDDFRSFVDFDGLPVRIFDTAGLRQTDDVIEAHGVELTKNLSEDADVILYLCDSSSGLLEDEKEFLNSVSKPVVFVWNKVDKVEKKPSLESDFRSANKYIKKEIEISAKKGLGFADLYSAVKEVLFAGLSSERPQAGLGSARQKTSVEEALNCVRHALFMAEEDIALDAVVQDLEDALNALGEVTGEVTADDVLGSIFSRFCVGK